MEFCENKLQTVANIENLQPSKLTQRLYMNFCKILCYRWSTLNQNYFKVFESWYIALFAVRGFIEKLFCAKVVKDCTIRHLELKISGLSVFLDFSRAEL